MTDRRTSRELVDARATSHVPPHPDANGSGFDLPPSDAELTPPPTQAGKKQSSIVREILETLLLAIVIFVAVRAVVLNFRVDGLSMFPNLDNGEMLLVNRNVYLHFDLYATVDWLPVIDHDEEKIVYPFHPPERGDIIVFNPPIDQFEKPYIKRVIALPGDTVEIREGAVWVNGIRLEETYLKGERTTCLPGQDCDEIVVPEGSVYVLGDNRSNSSDSRTFGPVPIDNIIGKAWITYWPVGDVGIVPHYDYPEISED